MDFIRHSLRDWRSYALVGIALLVAAYWMLAPHQLTANFQPPNLRHQSHQAGGEGCRPAKLRILPPTPKSKAIVERCADAEDAEKAANEALAYSARQTNASEQTARSADYQSRISLAQTLATIGAFVAAALAALYAAGALKAAQRSAAVGRLTMRQAKSFGKKELRAYVVVEIGSLAPIGPNQSPTAIVKLVNVGQTPAYQVRSICEIKIIDKNDNSFEEPKKEDIPERYQTLGAGKDIFVSTDDEFSLIALGISALQSKDAFIFVIGMVSYKDIFDDTHYTYYCHKYAGFPVRAAYHTHWNHSD